MLCSIKVGLLAIDYTARGIADIMGCIPSTSMMLDVSSAEGVRVLQAPVFPAKLPFIGTKVHGKSVSQQGQQSNADQRMCGV